MLPVLEALKVLLSNIVLTRKFPLYSPSPWGCLALHPPFLLSVDLLHLWTVSCCGELPFLQACQNISQKSLCVLHHLFASPQILWPPYTTHLSNQCVPSVTTCSRLELIENIINASRICGSNDIEEECLFPLVSIYRLNLQGWSPCVRLCNGHFMFLSG